MAMIEKKNYWLRHLILIICVVIILFPLVWLISTSIRRDNAAFSPKLFSSRVTLNNYKDLIIQKQNIPELVNELMSISSYIGEYGDITIEEAKKKSNKLLKELETYFVETNKNIDNIEQLYAQIFALYDSQYKDQFFQNINSLRVEDYKNFEQELTNLVNIAEELGIKVQFSNLQQLIKQYFKLRNTIISTLKTSNIDKNSAYYTDTMNLLLQIPINTSVWRVKTYRKWVSEEPSIELIGEDILSLGNMWKEIENEMNQLIENINLQVSNLFGETLQKISETESRVNSLNTHISQILSQQDTLKSNNQKNIYKISCDFRCLYYGERQNKI